MAAPTSRSFAWNLLLQFCRGRGNQVGACKTRLRDADYCSDGLVLFMMRFVKGNLLESQVEALVNSVNTVGVMGKGIALMFKEAFPGNFRVYEDACKRKDVRVGHMFVTEN